MSRGSEGLKVVKLQSELDASHTHISMLGNLIEQVRIALDEDDIDRARTLLSPEGDTD